MERWKKKREGVRKLILEYISPNEAKTEVTRIEKPHLGLKLKDLVKFLKLLIDINNLKKKFPLKSITS